MLWVCSVMLVSQYPYYIRSVYIHHCNVLFCYKKVNVVWRLWWFLCFKVMKYWCCFVFSFTVIHSYIHIFVMCSCAAFLANGNGLCQRLPGCLWHSLDGKELGSGSAGSGGAGREVHTHTSVHYIWEIYKSRFASYFCALFMLVISLYLYVSLLAC